MYYLFREISSSWYVYVRARRGKEEVVRVDVGQPFTGLMFNLVQFRKKFDESFFKTVLKSKTGASRGIYFVRVCVLLEILLFIFVLK